MAFLGVFVFAGVGGESVGLEVNVNVFGEYYFLIKICWHVFNESFIQFKIGFLYLIFQIL